MSSSGRTGTPTSRPSIGTPISRPSIGTPTSRPSTGGNAVAFARLLELAISGDRENFVDELESGGLSAMSERDDSGNTLLHLMAATGDLKMVKLLLRLGLAIDELNHSGQTASVVAQENGNAAISEYLERKLQPKLKPASVDVESHAQRGGGHDASAAGADGAGDWQQDYLDAVLNYAILIGIDVMNEPHLLSIAEEGLGAPLPAHWQQLDGKFYSAHSGFSQSEHPNDDIFRQRVIEARALASELEAGAKTDDSDGQQSPAAHAAAKPSCSGSEYGDDFEHVLEADEDAPNLQNPILDDAAARMMILLKERLQLKTKAMVRQTHGVTSPDYIPKAPPRTLHIYAERNPKPGRSQNASPSKDRDGAGSPDAASALPSILVGGSKSDGRSEFDRLMKRYMGFSATEARVSIDNRQERQRAVRAAIEGLEAKYNSITTSLRQFLETKPLERKPTKTAQHAPSGGKGASKLAHATLPAMPGSKKDGALQLTASPLRDSARPPNNPWIHAPKFTMLFNPQHMKPSKATSRYSKITPSHMEGRTLQSPSVSVSLYPSITPNRLSDDNDPFAYLLDPRRRHKLLAKQMERSDRPQCASPWSPELKKSGVWDKNGYLDCNAFLFGEKYVHFSRQNVGQMDLNEELRRKGVQKAEEMLCRNPDPYRHIKKLGAAAKSP